MDPHTERERNRPPHTDRYCVQDLMHYSFNCFLIKFCSQTTGSTHSKRKRKIQSTTYWEESLERLVLNSSICFFIEFCSQADGPTHWHAQIKTTTYWHESIDELNAQQAHMFLDWILFTGGWIHTLVHTYQDHHILTGMI